MVIQYECTIFKEDWLRFRPFITKVMPRAHITNTIINNKKNKWKRY